MSEEILKKASSTALKGANRVVYCGNMEKLKDKKGSDKRILVITDLTIASYKEGKSPAEETSCQWLDLSGIDKTDECIDLKFGPKISFRFKTESDDDTIFESICKLLYEIKSKGDLEKLKMDRFPQEVVPSTFGAFSRYDAVLKKNPKKPVVNDVVTKKFKPFCTQYQPVLTISDADKADPVFGAIAQALCLIPFPFAVLFGKIDKKGDPYGEFTKVLKENDNVRYIEFQSDFDKKFKDYCEAVKSNEHIHAIGFKGVEPKKDQYVLLRDLVINKDLKCLNFNGSFKAAGLSTLMKEMVNDDFVAHLKMLGLNNISGIKVKDLFPKFNTITCLSLAGCGLNVGDVFTLLAEQSELSLLMQINLSENKSKSESYPEKLPPCVKSVYVNNIKWEGSSFTTMIKCVFGRSYYDGLEFHCAKAKVDDAEFGNAITALADITEHPLTYLDWSENTINEGLITYIGQNTNLTTLVMNESIVSGKDDLITQLSSQLPNLSNLKILSLTGKSKSEAGAALLPILEALKSMSSIQKLILNTQAVGDDGVKAIAEIITQCSNLVEIEFDESKVTSIDPINDCLAAAEARAPFKVGFPWKDITALYSDKKIEKDSIPDLKRRVIRLSGKEIEDTQEPFDVYTRVDFSPDYPLYPNEELLAKIEALQPVKEGEEPPPAEEAAPEEAPAEEAAPAEAQEEKEEKKSSDSDSGDEKPKSNKKMFSDSDSEPPADKPAPPSKKSHKSSSSEEIKPAKKASKLLDSSSESDEPKPKKKIESDSYDEPPKHAAPKKMAFSTSSEEEKPKKSAPASKKKTTFDSESSDEEPPRKKAPSKKVDSDSDYDEPKKSPSKKAPSKKADSDSDYDEPKKSPSKKAPSKKADSDSDYDEEVAPPPMKRKSSKQVVQDSSSSSSAPPPPMKRKSSKQIVQDSSSEEEPPKRGASPNRRSSSPKRAPQLQQDSSDDEEKVESNESKYVAPNWDEFPINRLSTNNHANKKLFKKLNEEYSLTNVINALKTEK